MIATRVPQIDWEKGFNRHWNGGNPVVSHTFNALSFLFPQGEKYFIDVVREVAGQVNLSGSPQLAREIAAFLAQESIHTRQHSQYNTALEQLGYRNVVHDYIERIVKLTRSHLSPSTNLAMVCAFEHYTAVLGGFILNNPKVLIPAPPEMALIWGWHSAEETEHKAVCFDLYHAAGGGWLRRVSAFAMVTLNFWGMFLTTFIYLLHHDGCLKPSRLPGTLLQTLRFFFGFSGIIWPVLAHSVAYLKPGFHPWNYDNRAKMQVWLDAHQGQFRDINSR